MSSTIGGGAATMTRLARDDAAPGVHEDVAVALDDRLTGACSATMSPSFLASRSGISCEPPTKRRSWAPLAVSELRAKVPTLLLVARAGDVPEREEERELVGVGAEAGLGPAADEVLDAGGVDGVGADPLAERDRVPLPARGWDQGASTAISAA